MKQFSIGDKVTWCGVEGVVQKTSCDKYTVVLFAQDGFDYGVHFTKDGKYYSWHKEPSLFHVEDKMERLEWDIRWGQGTDEIGLKYMFPIHISEDNHSFGEQLGKRGKLIFIPESTPKEGVCRECNKKYLQCSCGYEPLKPQTKPTRKIEHWEHVFERKGVHVKGRFTSSIEVYHSPLDIILFQMEHQDWFESQGKLVNRLRSTLIETFEIEDV